MSDPAANLRRAEVTAAEARARLDGTVAELQTRLDPGRLAQEAKEAGSAVAIAGVEQARRNPGVVAGAMAALGLFLARGKIAGMVRRRRAHRKVPAAPRSPSSKSEDAS